MEPKRKFLKEMILEMPVHTYKKNCYLGGASKYARKYSYKRREQSEMSYGSIMKVKGRGNGCDRGSKCD